MASGILYEALLSSSTVQIVGCSVQSVAIARVQDFRRFCHRPFRDHYKAFVTSTIGLRACRMSAWSCKKCTSNHHPVGGKDWCIRYSKLAY